MQPYLLCLGIGFVMGYLAGRALLGYSLIGHTPKLPNIPKPPPPPAPPPRRYGLRRENEMSNLLLSAWWEQIFRKMEDASEIFALCDREMARRAAAQRGEKGERDEKSDTAG